MNKKLLLDALTLRTKVFNDLSKNLSVTKINSDIFTFADYKLVAEFIKCFILQENINIAEIRHDLAA